jgi:retinol dehydrogenase-12
MSDLRGRLCVITGASTGIGRVTALELARRGAELVLAGRSPERHAPVVEAIKRETGNAAVEFLPLDLGELSSVRRAAAALIAGQRPLHVLINNAGVAGAPGLTADGFEPAFGINHLGHFLLTTLLLDRLRASAPARVVTVASRAHLRVKGIEWAALSQPKATVTGLREYSVSKLCNVLFSAELARRLAGSGVTTYALHPGVIASDIWRRVPWPVRPIMNAFMEPLEGSAATTLHCAAAPEAAGETGLYYAKSRVARASRVAEDAALAAELWVRSEAWCAAPPRAG